MCVFYHGMEVQLPIGFDWQNQCVVCASIAEQNITKEKRKAIGMGKSEKRSQAAQAEYTYVVAAVAE